MTEAIANAGPPARNTARGKSRRWTKPSAQIAVGLALLAAWQITTQFQLVDPLIARTPAQVWAVFVEMVSTGLLWPSLYSTLEAIAITFVLAGSLGIIAGVGLGLFPKLEKLLDPFLNAANAMPRIALAPVFLIYFGIDQGAKVALASSIVFFIVMVNARAGIRTVDRDCLIMARMMDSSRLQMFFKILLPTAVPSIFAGLRLAVIYSFLGVITSEILSSRVGLGQLIAMYAGIFKLEGMYAVVLIMAVLASILNVGMKLIERRILRWKGDA